MIDYLSRIFASYREPVLGCDHERILFMNPSAEVLFSGNADTLRPSDCFPAEVLENTGENILAAFNHKGRHMAVSITHTETIQVFRVLAQDTLEQNGALAFVANISGQMRDPLSIINMVTRQISSSTENKGDPNLVKHLSMLYHSYYRLLRLSDNLLNYNRIAQNSFDFNLRNIDIIELCGSLISSVRGFVEKKNISLHFDTDTDKLVLAADASKIELMILNLLSNSLKYTRAGDRISISAKGKGRNFKLLVQDTGRGIPSELLTTSFFKYSLEKDYSDVFGGSGLGFVLARHIVERHSGTLLLESIKSKGTSVTVFIPKKHVDTDEFHNEVVDYRKKNMHMIYTELSDVFGFEDYGFRFMD